MYRMTSSLYQFGWEAFSDRKKKLILRGLLYIGYKQPFDIQSYNKSFSHLIVVAFGVIKNSFANALISQDNFFLGFNTIMQEYSFRMFSAICS